MTIFILVHGAMHGSWCWQPVTEPLRSAGHRVETVDMPGRPGGPQGVAPDLASYAAVINAAVDRCTEPAVLVAHSLGGVAAAVAAEARSEDLTWIVFVNSLILHDGEGALATIGSSGPDSVFTRAGALVVSEDGRTIFVNSADTAIEAFYGLCDAADAADAVSRLVPEPLAPVLETVRLTAPRFGSVAKTYIGSRSDRAVPWHLQCEMSARAGAEFIELGGDHSPFMSATDDLVGALIQAAAA